MTLPFGPIQPIPEPSAGGSLLAPWAVPVERIRTEPGGVDKFKEPLPGAEVRTALPPALFSLEGTEALQAAGVSATGAEPTIYWPNQQPDVQVGDELVVDGDRWTVHERPNKTPLGLVVIVRGVKTTRRAP